MFIAIEGLDGSGKATQTRLLYEYLKKVHKETEMLSYPKYGEPCCTPVQMYLDGAFGKSPSDVNAYTASIFFAVDRYADYKLNWEEKYIKNYWFVSDRYVQSNMIHQLTKLPQEDWETYIKWISDLEYKRNNLPTPDLTIYLDVEPSISQRLLLERYRADKRDIHERDKEYLAECHKIARHLATKQDWAVIPCTVNGGLMSVEAIHSQICEIVDDKFASDLDIVL